MTGDDWINNQRNAEAAKQYSDEVRILEMKLKTRHQAGVVDERNRIRQFVVDLIEARHEWAQSEDGIKQLGRGHPTIPGMQDLNHILHFIDTNDTDIMSMR